ncbi:hypothetical protein ACWEWD_34390 [Streptomyces tendae]
MHPRRMCLDCQTLTETPILLYAIERASGPAFPVYACPDCAPARLTPDAAMSQLFNHTTACPECTPLECCALGWALSKVVGRSLRRIRSAAAHPAADAPPPPPADSL